MKWKFDIIGNTCEILDSKRKPITKSKRVSGDYPYYGATGIVDFVNNYIFDDRLVLVGEDGAKWKSGDNTAFIVEGKVWVNNHAHVLKTKSVLDDAFLTYYLNHQDLTYYITGLTVPKLNQEKLRSIPVPVPPLPEQQKIVEKLDAAFELIDRAKANIEQNIQNAKELFQSKLNEVFTIKNIEGSEVKTIKDITTILGDGLHGTPKYDSNGDYYFVNGNNLINEKIVFKENTKRVNAVEFEKYRKNLNDKTILVSINGTLGNIAFYNNEKIILGKSACYFNVVDGVDKRFIMYQIKSPTFIKYAHKEATGATIKNVSLKSMRNFVIYLPKSLETQQKIVAQLDRLSAQTELLQQKYQQKLRNLEELRKSVLEKAFKGELV